MRSEEQINRSFLREWGACLAFLLFIGFLFVAAYPILFQTKAMSKVTSCKSTIRQLALQCNMYSEDWDEYYPRAAIWMDSIYPYVKNRKSYKCLVLEEKHPNSFGYMYNDRLDVPVAKKPAKRFDPDPSTTPMLFEGSLGAWNASGHDNSLFALRHNHKGNVAFLDGHTKAFETLDFTVH